MAAPKPEQWLLDLPPSAGTFNRLEWADHRLVASGWMFHPDCAPDAIEILVDGRSAGPARMHKRRPAAEKLHAWSTVPPRRFAFDATLDGDSVRSRIDVLGMLGGKAVTRMSCLIPLETDAGIPLPPEHLAARISGRHGPMLRQQGLRMYTDISDQMTRFGIAPSGRMLDWGCGCGRVTAPILARLPEARVVGCDIDREAIDWCRANLPGEFVCVTPDPPTRFADAEMDLVIACSVLTHLARNEQDRWLREIRRILIPGGYFLASTHGEYAYRRTSGQRTRPLWKRLLHRKAQPLAGIEDAARDGRLDGIAPPGYYRAVFQSRQYTVDAYSKYFTVVDYVECGLDGLQDLVILRRDPGDLH